MSVGEGGGHAVREQEIARYVAQVRQALADLPPEARDDLLEELPEHLAEVAAETDGPLADRLGPPEAYAAELRGAAGVRPPVTGRNLDQKIAAAVAAARGRLRTVDARTGPLIGYDRASDYLRLLRPVWWVVRGYLVAMLITAVLDGPSFGLMPRIGGSTLAALLLLAAAVLGSIWLGRRSDRFGPKPRLALHGTALVLVLFGLFAVVELDRGARSGNYNYESTYHDPYSSIQDVYVYDGAGRLIEGARLFDQNGQPIRLGYQDCPEPEPTWTGEPELMPEIVRTPPGETYPYCPHRAPFRFREPAPARPVPTDSAPVPNPSASAPAPDPSASPEPSGGAPAPGPSGVSGTGSGSPATAPTVTGPPVPTPTG